MTEGPIFTENAETMQRAKADQDLAELTAKHERAAWGMWLANGIQHLAAMEMARHEGAVNVPGGMPALERLYGYALETIERGVHAMLEQHRGGKLT